MTRFLIAAAAAAVLLFSAPAAADTAALSQALEARDTAALAEISDGRGSEARLAAGVLAAFHREDEAAIRDLRASARARSLSPELRAEASRFLAGVYMRQGRFAEASAAFASADALFTPTDPTEAASVAQARRFAEALAGVAPMRAEVAMQGEAAITRDLAQLARADVVINGATQDAVLDTGAAYSTIARSVAERFGLRILDTEVTVGSATAEALPARVAVADRLELAGGVFHDVVFIVLPDEALTFANGAYKIEAIVGLPVLMQFGRIEFVAAEGGERMRHNHSGVRAADSNLILDGLQPVALIRAPEAGVVLNMILDTGAQRTGLTRNAATEFPALVHGAETRATTFGGAGGMTTQDDALSINTLVLEIGGAPVTLSDVRVTENARNRHGLLGQDVLRAHGGYVLDFEAMRLELLAAG